MMAMIFARILVASVLMAIGASITIGVLFAVAPP